MLAIDARMNRPSKPLSIPHCRNMRILILLSLAISHPANCDIFSSTAHIQSLMHLERHLVSSLSDYLENTEQKIQEVRSYLNEFAYTAGQMRYAGTFADHLMDNPLQAFQLLKRLAINWNKIENVMTSSPWDQLSQFVDNYRTLLPSQEDLNDAALALIRLQDTYNLNMTDLANGHIHHTDSRIQMSARDCLFLGKNAFNNGYYGHSLDWFEEALMRAHLEGNHTASVDEITPFYRMAIEFIDNLDDELKEKNNPEIANKLRVVEGDNEDYQNYQKLCRGERIAINRTVRDQDLRCYYSTNNGHPLLLIRPVKVEVFSVKPFVALHYDVLADTEIEIFKELATPVLTRARVQTESNSDEISKSRVSQTAWFTGNSHPLLARVNARIEAITGLSADMDKRDCELIQIANYGMGGHYVPHYDYLFKDRPEEERINLPEEEMLAGDRIATFMFYLSDVISGGATVFTRLGIRVNPVKGSAIFWYNLFRNGEGILDTVHGACPVLMGEKWVANYWIREHGQLLHRPCSLRQNE